VTSAAAERAQAVCERLRAMLEETLPSEARALGPAPRFRLRGRERRQLLVKAGDRGSAVAAVRGAVDNLAGSRALRDVALSVDVDAQ
jgi:primosomal protein N'